MAQKKSSKKTSTRKKTASKTTAARKKSTTSRKKATKRSKKGGTATATRSAEPQPDALLQETAEPAMPMAPEARLAPAVDLRQKNTPPHREVPPALQPRDDLDERPKLRLAGDNHAGGMMNVGKKSAAGRGRSTASKAGGGIPLPETKVPREVLGDALALFQAARLGRGDDVRRRLQAGVDANLTDDPANEHREAIHFMCKHEDVGQANIDGMKLGRTACHMAAIRGHTDVLRGLIEHGADINLCDHAGRTALMLACSAGFNEAARLLVQAGARFEMQDLRGNTALFLAASRGHSAVARMLVEQGAEVNIRDIDGRTPLIAASSAVHAEVVEVLLDAGADIDLEDATGMDALLAAVCAVEPSRHTGPGPFFAIAEERIVPIVRMLVEAGADDRADSNGVRPSRRAQERGQDEVARILQY